ncbi:MAG: ribosome biogenesis GTP-binding protein YihA/YsxC [Candidatus Krumholzibacteriia bacterium]
MKIRSLAVACTTLDAARFPKSPWKEIAVSGRSNVGKSSLLNTLFERKNFARISNEPGKTRTMNFYAVNDRFYLVDFPGYGFARLSSETRKDWLRIIDTYIDERSALAGVVQLVDARHAPSKEDVERIEHIAGSERPFIVVFTKVDKISNADRFRAVREFNESVEGIARIAAIDKRDVGEEPAAGGSVGAAAPALFFSAKTGEGREDLWRWIMERIR